ncbi:MAG: hypothetical protein Q4D30_06900 [Bacteroidales bacterium]|nr:hypothetical protein [Bacteroidales bacterium]
MKTLKLLTFYLLMGMLSIGFYSCSNDDDPTSDTPTKPFLYIDISKYKPVKIDGNSQIVSVELFTNIDPSTIELDFVGGADWVSFNDFTLVGYRQYVYTFNVEANETSKSRRVSIAFLADGVDVTGAAILQYPKENQ